MGVGEASIFKKCGDILINLKTKKKKSKYTFNCAFCNANYDQLKKFSIHLEDVHQEFPEEPKKKIVVLEPEIKVEELSVLQTNADLNQSLTNVNEKGINVDPLESTESTSTNDFKTVDIIDTKNEGNFSDMDYEDCFVDKDDINCDEFENVNREKAQKSKMIRMKNAIKYNSDASSDDSKDDDFDALKDGSDVSSDDSKDADFDLNNLYKSKQKVLKKKIANKENAKGSEVPLLKSFEKHPKLWNVNERTTDNDIIQQSYETIAQEVNDLLNASITWQIARKRINEMRFEYSNELEKQRKGIEHEMPWYSEHMKFLKENIDFLLKNRTHKKKYRRLTNMDETQLAVLIKLYKKHEHLWNVNNIDFGFRTKKAESYNEMVKELKLNHNLDITVENLHRRINYIKRLYSKDKELQLKCELEKREFTPTSVFYLQMSFFDECEGPFKCRHCNKIIERYETYHVHVAEHTNTVPFQCKLCEKSYKTFKEMLVHNKKHLGLYKKHECTVCGKSTKSKQEMDYHMTSHTGDRPFLCQICGANFRALHVYHNHMLRHEKRYRHECHICKRGFHYKCKLNEHIKSHLNIRDIICNICGKAFTTKKNLGRHIYIHEKKKRYKCKVCGKEFAQDAGLRAHRKLHLTFQSTHLDNIRKAEVEF